MCEICKQKEQLLKRAFSEEELTQFEQDFPFQGWLFSEPYLRSYPAGLFWLAQPGMSFLGKDEVEAIVDGLTGFMERFSDEDIEFLNLRCQDKGRAAPKQQSVRLPRPGYVYVLKGETGHRKIGRTANPETRLKAMQQLSPPIRVEYELIMKTGDTIQFERDLHLRFADKHISAEWFALSDQDVADLREEFGDE